MNKEMIGKIVTPVNVIRVLSCVLLLLLFFNTAKISITAFDNFYYGEDVKNEVEEEYMKQSAMGSLFGHYEMSDGFVDYYSVLVGSDVNESDLNKPNLFSLVPIVLAVVLTLIWALYKRMKSKKVAIISICCVVVDLLYWIIAGVGILHWNEHKSSGQMETIAKGSTTIVYWIIIMILIALFIMSIMTLMGKLKLEKSIDIEKVYSGAEKVKNKTNQLKNNSEQKRKNIEKDNSSEVDRSTTKYCANCGQQLDIEAKYCTSCGNEV